MKIIHQQHQSQELVETKVITHVQKSLLRSNLQQDHVPHLENRRKLKIVNAVICNDSISESSKSLTEGEVEGYSSSDSVVALSCNRNKEKKLSTAKRAYYGANDTIIFMIIHLRKKWLW